MSAANDKSNSDDDIGALIYKCSRTAAARAKAATLQPPDTLAVARQSSSAQRIIRFSTRHTARNMTQGPVRNRLVVTVTR